MKRHLILSICIGGMPLTGCVTHSPPFEVKRPVYYLSQPAPVRKRLEVQVRPSIPLEAPKKIVDEVGAATNLPMAYTKEWYEREEEIDQRLRRIMIICRGC